MTVNVERKGHYEILAAAETNRFLGTRPVDPDGRRVGPEGEIEVVLTEDTTLDRGTGTILVAASPERPLRCKSTINSLCGRLVP